MWVIDMDKIFLPNLSSLKCVREGHNLKEHFIRLCKVNNSILWLPRCVCSPPTSSYPMCSTPAMCQALCNAHSPDLNAEEAYQGQHIQVDTIDSSTQTCSAQSSPVQYNGNIPIKSAPHYLLGFLFPLFLPSNTSLNSGVLPLNSNLYLATSVHPCCHHHHHSLWPRHLP